MNAILKRVFQRLHYPFDVILLCVRWYVAYPLSLRHLEEMMAERGVSVDHSTVHRWAIKLLPVLEKAFHQRKRPVGKSWRMDETYIKVNGAWKYSIGPSTRRATPSISCCGLAGTRLPPVGISKNRSRRTVRPRP
ncbi:transposase [Burkholderia ubonensis]|nr:transposase [Burkholderia ubonensis]